MIALWSRGAPSTLAGVLGMVLNGCADDVFNPARFPPDEFSSEPIAITVASLDSPLTGPLTSLTERLTSPNGDAEVRVHPNRVIRAIPRALYGTNIEWVFAGLGLWDSVSNQSQAEVLSLTRDAGLTFFRFPGGAFSDFYHWSNGIGHFNTRLETEYFPGSPVSPHTLGTDEAIRFARDCGGRLLITVNAGTGTAIEAASWVRYVNGGRAPDDPQRVQEWEVGNELYLRQGSPSAATITLPPEAYAELFVEFARAMRAEDPLIRVGAIGSENQGAYAISGYADWNQTLLQVAGEEIDFLAVHNAYAPALFDDQEKDVRTVYAAMLAAPLHVRDNLAALVTELEELNPRRSTSIAVTEWGPLFSGEADNRYVDHIKTLGSALYVGCMLKLLLETPRVEIANAFKLVDHAFMGWIGQRDGRFVAKAPLLAIQMYTQHFGDVLVETSVRGPTYASTKVGFIDSRDRVPVIEAVTSCSADKTALFVILINKHFDSAATAFIDLGSFEPDASAIAWTLTGTGIDANTGTTLPQVAGMNWAAQATDLLNPRFEQGAPGEVGITRRTISLPGPRFNYELPPHSITSLQIRTDQSPPL